MQLQVKVLEAKLLRQADQTVKSTVEVTVGAQKRQTTHQKNDGVKPLWEEALYFKQENPVLVIKVNDHSAGQTTFVGQGTFDIRGAFIHPNEAKTFPIDIFKENQLAGKVLVTVVWEGQVKTAQKAKGS